MNKPVVNTQPRPRVPVHRYAATLPGVKLTTVKADLWRLNLLRRNDVRKRFRVRKSTARHLFEERVWERTGKTEIFPTEAGEALLRELYEKGKLTLKAGWRDRVKLKAETFPAKNPSRQD